MTTLREAAQQALEALGEIEWSNNSNWQSDRAATVIPALRAALAEPVECPHGVTDGNCKECYEQSTTLRKPLTGEEIDQIAIKGLASPVFDPGWNRNLARAIEAAHGIGDA